MLRTDFISASRVGSFMPFSASVMVAAAPQPYTLNGSFGLAFGSDFLSCALYSFIAASFSHSGSSGSLK